MCTTLPHITGEGQVPGGLWDRGNIIGWSSALNGTLTSASGVSTLTKTATGLTESHVMVTLPIVPTNVSKSWVFAGRSWCSQTTNDNQCFQLFKDSTHAAGIFFNSDGAGNKVIGTIAIVGCLNGTPVPLVVATGIDTTQPLDWKLYWDSKYKTLTCKLRDANGRWRVCGRVVVDTMTGSIQLRPSLGGISIIGSTLSWSKLIVGYPQAIAFGDSQPKGDGMFDPDPNATGGPFLDDDYTWMRWVNLYSYLFSNDVENYGHGGDTSAVLLARFNADVILNRPKVVFLHCSNNDKAATSYTDRTAAIQSMIDMANAAGIHVVLINSDYGTSNNLGQTAIIDYYKVWWDTYATTLIGVACFIDRNVALSDGGPEGYIDQAYIISSSIPNWHLNVAGATIEGTTIQNS